MKSPLWLLTGLLLGCGSMAPPAVPGPLSTSSAADPAPAGEPPPKPTPQTLTPAQGKAPAAGSPTADGAAPSVTPASPHSASASTSKSPPASAIAKAPAPLPADTVVLHVGDSMADALGKSLRRELKKRGIKNYLEAKEATYIPQWAGRTMRFAQHLKIHDPDLVIITLGGNEVAMPDPNVRAEPVRRMVEMVGDRPCIWIAAPLWPGAPHTGILKVIKDNCAPCIYVDTNALIGDLKRLGDRVHPTIKERGRWARFMIRWLQHNRKTDGKRPWDFNTPTSAPPDPS